VKEAKFKLGAQVSYKRGGSKITTLGRIDKRRFTQPDDTWEYCLNGRWHPEESVEGEATVTKTEEKKK